ncbi:hypothetical protein KY333_02260 [Candidatus Woesearchaeota archaeon]|nr:hypothetical protein [Candidatus Woesearchaeota archaeon]
MVDTFLKTKSGPGILAKIEGDQARYAFEHLKTILFSFYAKRGAVLEDKEYAQHKLIKNNPTWNLTLIHKGKNYGRVQIQYVGYSDERKLWRSWKSQNFLVYFNLKRTEEICIKERDRFKEFIQPAIY